MMVALVSLPFWRKIKLLPTKHQRSLTVALPVDDKCCMVTNACPISCALRKRMSRVTTLEVFFFLLIL